MKQNFYFDCEINDELATRLHQWIGTIGEEDEVEFVYNSGGGSVQAGLAIYDMISAMPQRTTSQIIGLCASAATYPALAADEVEMTQNATVMIHPVQGGIWGTIKQLEQDLEWMNECEARVKAIYAAKTGLPVEEITAMMDATTYMDAQFALDHGFVDRVEGLVKASPEEEEVKEEEAKEEEEVQNEEEVEEEEKKEEGLVNRILSLAGLKERGEVFHAPVEDEKDFQEEIKTLQNEVAAKDNELRNAAAAVDHREAEFANYKEQQLREIEELKASLRNAAATLEERVKAEVANRFAALGYDSAELPAPANPRNCAPAELSDNQQFLKELGIEI